MTIDYESIAAECFSALAAARPIPLFSNRYPGIGLDDAYRAMGRLCKLREAHGETVVGRKIGFTNRTIWATPGLCLLTMSAAASNIEVSSNKLLFSI